MDFSSFDLVVVGSGFFGATVAQQAAEALGLKVLIVEKRGHIGGNSYSAPCRETGIEVHEYGAHLFHTSNKAVWDYVQRFAKFTDYRHQVYSAYQGKLYSLPINLGTICQFYERHFTPSEAKALLRTEALRESTVSPSNLEEKAISLIGRSLYEAFIKGYTAKQWNTDPKKLPASVIQRLPVRFTMNNRYFNDKYEGLPSDGYGALFRRMLDSSQIHILTDTDYFEIRSILPRDIKTIYTGPIDRYFDYRAGRLPWRTIDFEKSVEPVNDFQGTAVVNYADEHIPFTRIIEFKHLHPEKEHAIGRTVISREYARFASGRDEPYYPINTEENKRLYNIYKDMQRTERNVIFGGRLGSYRYIDMHQAIAAGFKCVEQLRCLLEGE